MKICFFSGYDGLLTPFGKSLEAIVKNSFDEIGIDLDYRTGFYLDDSDAYCGTAIFAMTPERFFSTAELHWDCLRKFDRVILWNLEPSSDDAYGGKFYRRYIKIKEILGKFALDELWLYNDSQIDFFKDISNTACKHVPIGFCKSMVPKRKVNKQRFKHKSVLFLGNNTEYRTKFFKVLRGKYRVLFNEGINIRKHSLNNYRSVNHTNSLVSNYRCGIDIRASEMVSSDRHIRWHRIMCYAANRVILFSDTALEKYGFKRNVHYVHFKNVKEIANLLREMIRDDRKQEKMANRMISLASKNFCMVKIFKSALSLEKKHDNT